MMRGWGDDAYPSTQRHIVSRKQLRIIVNMQGPKGLNCQYTYLVIPSTDSPATNKEVVR